MFFSHRVTSIAANVNCMLGCGSGHVVSCTPANDLEANLGYLRDDNGNRVLFISLDALYVGPVLTRKIEDGLHEILSPHEIFLGASHSHNAPILDDTKPLLGEPLASHVSWVAHRIVMAARDAIADSGSEVSIRSRQYRVRNTVNRRKLVPVALSRAGITFFKTEQVPNLRDDLEPTSEVLEFVTDEQVVIATLWVMPCHPTSYPEIDEVSSHYIGHVRQKLREQSGNPGYPLLFFQGASGDLRPPALSKRAPGLMGFLKNWFQPQGFAAFSRAEYETWCDAVWEELSSSSRNPEWELIHPVSTKLSTQQVHIDLDQLYEYSYNLPRKIQCHKVTIGSLKLVGLAAEVTWGFRKVVLPKIGLHTLIGCIGDTYGYLASSQQYSEGGYEAEGFTADFSLTPLANSNPPGTIASLIS